MVFDHWERRQLGSEAVGALELFGSGALGQHAHAALGISSMLPAVRSITLVAGGVGLGGATADCG